MSEETAAGERPEVGVEAGRSAVEARRCAFRTTGTLLVVFLSFLVAMGIVMLFPPLITYKWEVASSRVRSISRRVADACRVLDETAISVDVVDDWLTDKLPPGHPLARELGESLQRAPWRNAYRCIRFVHVYHGEPRTFGIYSMGRDGVSETEGNDTDDLNSWNSESVQWYIDDIRRRRLWECLAKAVLLTPIVYCGVVGIGWVLGLLCTRSEGIS